MSSEDEDIEYRYNPDSDTPVEGKKTTSTHVIPAASRDKYKKAYDDFQKWNELKGTTPISQNVLIKYFVEIAEKNKPTTLWSQYSMIKATLRSNDNIDITSWSKLLDFLKRNKRGYKPAKAKIFTGKQIEKFINEAPDEQWLDIKVVCIFGINGTFSANKLVNIKVENIKQYEDMFWVIIPNAETKQSFTISGTFFSIVQKYVAMRPKTANTNRFFLTYQEGKCTEQPHGKNKFNGIPRKIAKYLNLPQPELYSGPSFRIASANEFIARHSICKTLVNMPNSDACDSTIVAEQNTYASIHPPNGCSLDYETGLLKRPSISYIAPPVTAASANNNNDDNEHVCTISCGQVKCAKEDNEKKVLHAFSTTKPSDYAITEVIPAQFASDPTCRWMVAYSHFIEPVSFYNSEEKFEEITRSIPNNVRVVEKYVRCNSSRLFAAYVVVYGVKCRCQKPIFGPHCAQTSDVFRKRNSDPLSPQTSDVFRKQNYDPLSAQPSDEISFSVTDIKCEL